MTWFFQCISHYIINVKISLSPPWLERDIEPRSSQSDVGFLHSPLQLLCVFIYHKVWKAQFPFFSFHLIEAFRLRPNKTAPKNDSLYMSPTIYWTCETSRVFSQAIVCLSFAFENWTICSRTAPFVNPFSHQMWRGDTDRETCCWQLHTQRLGQVSQQKRCR